MLACLGGCSLVVDLFETSPAATDGGSNLDSGTTDARPGTTRDAAPTICASFLADGTCVIECDGGSCGSEVVCPAGIPCQVRCVDDAACEHTAINCAAASRCDIICHGQDACDQGGITCGGTECTISCFGYAACEEAPIECLADLCTIECIGPNACAAGVCCQGGACQDACSSNYGGNCNCF